LIHFYKREEKKVKIEFKGLRVRPPPFTDYQLLEHHG